MSRTEWPEDWRPVVQRISLSATLRGDEPVAIVEVFDITNDSRVLEFPVDSALDLLAELAKFVRQVAYTNVRACPHCGLPAVRVVAELNAPTRYEHDGGRVCVMEMLG